MEKLRQVNFKDRDRFFQEFKELTHYAGVRTNEQVMVAQIKRATHETSKNTIYAGDGDLPNLYNDWKSRLLRIDYNWHLKQAEGMGRTGTNDKGTGTKGSSIDKCTHAEDTVRNHIRRAGSAHGYRRSNRDNEVLPIRKARSLQDQLPQQAEDQGGSSPSGQHLLGQPSNGRGNGDSWGGKRGCQEVTDSTYSAKDLVFTWYAYRAWQMYSYICSIYHASEYTRDFAIRPETKQESHRIPGTNGSQATGWTFDE